MASQQQDNTVFAEEDQDLEEDDESSSSDDLEVLPDDDEEENENDEDDLNSATAITVAFPSSTASVASASVSASAVTVAVPPSVDEPDPNRNRVKEEVKPPPPQPPAIDESRRLFQRLWTDEDEIELLQGFLDYTTQRGIGHHHDTALFYDQIKSKLQLDFNKNQLVEKLRRLKKKYRNVISKISSGKDFAFKTPHDQATFEISSKIWSNTTINNNNTPTSNNNTTLSLHSVSVLDDEDANHSNFTNHHLSFGSEMKMINNHSHHHHHLHHVNSYEDKVITTPTPRPRKRARPSSKAVAGGSENVVFINNSDSNVNMGNVGHNGVAGAVEETMRNCLSPMVKELMGTMMGGGSRGVGGLGMNSVMPFGGLGMGFGGFGSGEVVDEKWRKQQIMELEVYSKRLELVQDQIKVALEELRSTGG